MIKFELNNLEEEEAKKFIEAVGIIHGNTGINDIEYIFASGGAIGPHTVTIRCKLANAEKNITDYDSW